MGEERGGESGIEKNEEDVDKIGGELTKRKSMSVVTPSSCLRNDVYGAVSALSSERACWKQIASATDGIALVEIQLRSTPTPSPTHPTKTCSLLIKSS